MQRSARGVASLVLLLLVTTLLLVATPLLAVTPADAQETINYASISGRVTDPQGAPAPGATVTARQLDTNVTAEVTTGSDGRFRFPYLKVGKYEVKVRLQGFTDATRALTLTVGSAFDLPVTLAVGGLDTSITVSGEATVLEVVDAQNTLTQAQGAYHDGVVRYRAALANLQTLTGTM